MSDKATMRMKLFKCHVRDCKASNVEPLKWEAFKQAHREAMAHAKMTGFDAGNLAVDMATRHARSIARKARDKAVCDMFDGDLNLTVQQVANRFGLAASEVNAILMNKAQAWANK